jgi:succinate dehydrogenase / fumarate reductase cytochrome b subunit
VSLVYILAVALLCVHLYHGLWSMLQSLGWTSPRHSQAIKKGAAALAIVVCLGFVSVPLAVMAGLVTY